VKAPRPAKKEINPLTPEQARIFLEVASRDRFEALYVLAIHCGLREGELLGLKWDDLHLEAGTLSVRRTLSETREVGRIFEPPKNGKGRNVMLTPCAIETLRAHLQRQLDEIERVGDGYQDQGLVFPSQAGTPMNAKNLIARSFKPLLVKAGLHRSVRLHDLRHTCPTILLGKGVHPKIVQELLGHATISITLDTYSHVLPNMQRQATDAMESVLSN
jgi:integrase